MNTGTPQSTLGFPGRTSPLVLLGAALLLVGGCECPPGGPGVTYYRMPADSLGHAGTALRLPASARVNFAPPPKGTPPQDTPVDKIHPDVQAAVLADPNRTDTLLISFRDTVDRAAVRGLGGQTLIDKLTGLRKNSLDADSALVTSYGATVLYRYWLIEALLVEMPYTQVQGLSGETSVVRIEPRYSGTPPTDCGSALTSTLYTDESIQAAGGYSDFAGGRIALFDTGIWDEHKLLGSNPLLGKRFQCSINGCEETDAQEDAQKSGHGTSSAAILIANDEVDPAFRGMTQATLDSYAVYGSVVMSEPLTDAHVAALALSKAVAAVPPYDVFLPVVAVYSGGPGVLTQAANMAFNQDILVIAPNGTKQLTDIPSPAVSAFAVGVGAYCVLSGEFKNNYTLGVTPDSRPKPDFTAPTYVYTAALDLNNPGNSIKMAEYTGTSCAAPVAAAGALKLRNWMAAATDQKIPPGAVYSLLYACTRTEGTSAQEGAGRLQLPTSGTVYWGVLPLKEGLAWNIPVVVADGVEAEVSAAIWWPEYGDDGTGIPVADLRDDFDLYLLDETGGTRDQSTSYTSVFERVSAAGVRGTAWSLQLAGYRVHEESKDVFWALWVRD